LVVGWDFPAGGTFWQEFNKEPEPEQNGEVDWSKHPDWQEVLRNGGMWPGLPLAKLKEDMPDDLRPLVTDEVMALLSAHRDDPDSGYNVGPIDLTNKEEAQ
jgi:hypothetical protein